jgi:membrane protein AbrB duplication
MLLFLPCCNNKPAFPKRLLSGNTSPMPALLSTLLQIFLAGTCGLVFAILGIPAAWLSGAMIATIFWNMTAWSRPLPQPLVQTALLLSGVTMGAGATPETLHAIERYPGSIAILVAGVICITWASSTWLVRIGRWPKEEAFFASVPGALSAVIATAVDRGSDVSRVILVQLLRLAALILLLPMLIAILGGKEQLPFLIGEGMPVTGIYGFTAMLAGGWVAGTLFKWIRLAAPMLLGGMTLSTILHVTGMTHGVVPPDIATFGLVLIGIFIGERFQGQSLEALRKVLPVAFGALLISLGVSFLFAYAAARFAHAGFADALVAFAPGGLEAMMALALLLGLDPIYVGLHHIVRFLGIGFTLPLVAKYFGSSGPVRRP